MWDDVFDVASGEKPVQVSLETETIEKFMKDHGVAILVSLFLVFTLGAFIGTGLARKLI